MNPGFEMSPTSTRYLRAAGWSLAAVLLLLPALAMRVTSEVSWTLSDFAFAAIVFGTVGGLLELAARASANLAFRLGAGCAVLTALLIVWINAAVGIVGDSGNPANLAYLAILAAGAAGTLTAGRDARRLARAMRVTAMAQALVTLVHIVDGAWPAPVLDGFFALTWLLAGALFARAARQQSGA